jgi:1-acyl-sn-glycerol-3-phosphate acyltransferase
VESSQLSSRDDAADRSEVGLRYGRLGFWYRLVIVPVRPFLRMSTKHEWGAQDKIPASGGCIIAANHVSKIDPMTLGYYILESGRTPKYLAKSSLFEKPLIKHIFIGAKQIPVYRGTADAAGALSAAVDAVNLGDCLLIYPEGTATRDPDCWPMRARTGVARLALTTGAPVIPVAQWGPQELWPYRSKLPRIFPRKRVQVLAGDPVDLTAYAGTPVTVEVLREVTDLIMARITEQLIELRGGQPPAVAYDPRLAA